MTKPTYEEWRVNWRILLIMLVIFGLIVVLYIYVEEGYKRSAMFCEENNGIYRSNGNECTINKIPYYVLHDSEEGYYLQEVR